MIGKLKGLIDSYGEDFVILEAQQAMMSKRPDAPQISTINDRASFFARKMVERLAETERRAPA